MASDRKTFLHYILVQNQSYSILSKSKAIFKAAEARSLLPCSAVTVVVNRVGVSIILPWVELVILVQDVFKFEVLVVLLNKKRKFKFIAFDNSFIKNQKSY